jgi:hypothetical protein
MESCQNHFWGALNTSPPKKIHFSQEQEITQEREFVASQIGNYKKMFLILQTYLGGQSYYPPPFNPQIQCLPGLHTSLMWVLKWRLPFESIM